MRLKLSTLLLVASLALTSSLIVNAQAPASQAVATRPAARTVVTLAHFNDVYEIGAMDGGKSGGLARVATLVSSLKRTTSALLVTMGGDYLSPSAIGTARVNGEPLAGRQMVDVLNAAGLQWATLGNHEFDVTEAAFKLRMAESKFGVVVSNVTDAQGKLFDHTVSTAVVPLKVNGRVIRIGLIGLVGDFTQKPWVKYQPTVEAGRIAIAALKGKVDAIVALTHLSLAQDADVANALPEIDLILGGHEHENWMLRRGPHFTPIVKADANVRSLAIVSMEFGGKGTRPKVSAEWRLVDAQIKPAAAVEKLVEKWTTLGFEAFHKDGFDPTAAVALLTDPLDGRQTTVRNRPGLLTQIIANSMRREANAELGVFNGGSVRIDDVLLPGPVTEYDVIRVVPFGGKVVRATLEGSLLARVLDQGLQNIGNGGYLHESDGTTHTPQGWVINGAPLDVNRKYVVGISDFLLTGGETNLGYLTRTNPGVTDITELRDVRRAVIDELKARYK